VGREGFADNARQRKTIGTTGDERLPMTTGQEEDKSQTTFAHGARRNIVKPIQCWEGANGSLKKSQWDAAADIIGNASCGDVNQMLNDPIPTRSLNLRDVVLWMATELQRNKKTPAKTRKKR
jgi:hypothetical protein